MRVTGSKQASLRGRRRLGSRLDCPTRIAPGVREEPLRAVVNPSVVPSRLLLQKSFVPFTPLQFKTGADCQRSGLCLWRRRPVSAAVAAALMAFVPACRSHGDSSLAAAAAATTRLRLSQPPVGLDPDLPGPLRTPFRDPLELTGRIAGLPGAAGDGSVRFLFRVERAGSV